MAQLDPGTVGAFVPIVAAPSIVVFTYLIIDALRDDLNDTRAQLAEVQERLDFAERLLTAGRKSQEDRSG
jgi:hypothetical protein